MPQYRGLEVVVPENDLPHREYLARQSSGRLTLQKCDVCGLFRYPPGPLCPDCNSSSLSWEPLSGKGTIYSYVIVPHAVNPAFRDWAPYPLVLVELDEQRGEPSEHRALRMVANVVDAGGNPELEENLAIGKRVEVTMADLGDGWALPLFRLSDENPEREPWQFAAGS